jgi:acetylornithine deacetylase/succinyl-diaminopimelate desuccinylase-like protein
VVHAPGGHSSLPPAFDPVATLARALVRVSDLRFPARVLPVVKPSLSENARAQSAEVRAAIERVAARGQVSPDDDRLLSTVPTINALLRTTCVATMLEAAPQDNVLPTTAKAVINCRILPDETREQTEAALRKTIDDPKVELARTGFSKSGPLSPVDGEVPAAMRKVAARLFPKTTVTLSMSAGASDSCHLRGFGIAAYGTGLMPISHREAVGGHRSHGPDERRPLAWWRPGITWLRELTRELTR